MIATFEDAFTRELWLNRARWTAQLASGLRVIMDDGRPGLDPPSAWLRLGQYCQEKRDHVIGLYLSFRNETPIALPEFAEGYFFRNKLGMLLGSHASDEYFLAGYLHNGKVVVRHYLVPTLRLMHEEERDPDDPKLVGPSLIRAPTAKK